jgi:hypothetical protein
MYSSVHQDDLCWFVQPRNVLPYCVSPQPLPSDKHAEYTSTCILQTRHKLKPPAAAAAAEALSCVGFCMQCLISVSLPARKLLNAGLLARC